MLFVTFENLRNLFKFIEMTCVKHTNTFRERNALMCASYIFSVKKKKKLNILKRNKKVFDSNLPLPN